MSERSTPDSGIGRYDLAVIGAGSAGFSAAITAADEGAKVVLVGHGTIGGTCVNVGCVPSKALIRAVEPLHQARAASRFEGIAAQASLTDWRAVRDQKDALVKELRNAKYVDLLPAYDGVDYIEGKARFTAKGLNVDGHRLAAEKIVIATGSTPALPDIPGVENISYLTSTTAFELAALPSSMMILGGGYIGAELAQMFSRAGVAVTLVFRSRLLPEAEPEISEALTGYLRDEGIAIHGGLAYRSISQKNSITTLDIDKDGQVETLTAETLVLATGRRPNTKSLALESYGIATDTNGGIVVDERMRTSREGIYAAGDVTGRDQFVYMAAYGAKIAARNALNSNSFAYDNSAMPAVVFTDPQVASVGFTEAEAEDAGHAVKTSVIGLDNVPRALAARDTRGLIKLIADKDSKKLLGAHILAPEGADSIQTAALALKAGLTVDDLGSMIFPYLTTVEGLKLAAQTFDMDVSKLSCCAG
jgi:mercury(II) reductase